MLNRSEAPAIHELGEMAMLPTTTTVLENGVTLILLNQDNFSDINRVTVVMGGGICDTPVHTIAPMSVNLLREGVEGLTGDEVADEFDTAGSWLKGGAVNHSRFVTLYSLNSNFNEQIKLFVRTITAPTFPEENVEKARQQAINQLHINYRKVAYMASLRTRQIIYPEGNTLHLSDTVEQISAITSDDLRKFHFGNLDPHNIKVYAAGHLTPPMLDSLKQELLKIEPVKLREAEHVDDSPTMLTEGITEFIEVPDAQQNAIQMTIPVIGPEHPDFTTLKAAVVALGGYFGSRLMSSIREEKGYTYGINASVTNFYGVWAVRITTECAPAYTQAVIDEVANQISLLVSNPPDQNEMKRLHQTLITSLASVIESPFAQIMHRITLDLFGSRPDTFDANQTTARTITSEQIADMVKKYIINQPMVTVVSGYDS